MEDHQRLFTHPEVKSMDVKDPEILSGFKVKTKPRNLTKFERRFRRYKRSRRLRIYFGITMIILTAVTAYYLTVKELI